FMTADDALSRLGFGSAAVALVLVLVFTSAGTQAMTDGVQTYNGLRELALKTSPNDLKLQLDSGETIAYGVLMEMGLPKGTATLTSYSTGDASLYLSTGGGVIGGIHHDNVRSAAKLFVSSAQAYLSKLNEVATFPLPPAGSTHFFVLTNHGVYGSA